MHVIIHSNIDPVLKKVMPFFNKYPLENTNQEISQLINQVLLSDLLPSTFTSKEINYLSQSEAVLSRVIQYVLKGWPYSLSEQLIPYYYCGNELLLENLSSLWGNRIIIPIIPECYIL